MPVSDREIRERRALGLSCSEGCYDCSGQDTCIWFNADQDVIRKALEKYDKLVERK